MSFYVVTIYDNKRWERIVNHSFQFDFNHTWYYHSTTLLGDPLLLVYEEKNDFIALPLIRRRDNSVFSYAGPVSSRKLPDIGLQEHFESAFLQFLEREQITRASIRLHPVIHKDFRPLFAGRLQMQHNSLIMDFTASPELYSQQLGEQFEYHARLLHKKGFTVRKALAIHDVDKFANLYRNNMARLRPDYHDKAWFRQMLRPVAFDTRLLLCCYGEEIAAGVLLTFCNDIMHVHLAATNEHYLLSAPLRLLLSETLQLGKTLKMEYLLLGGLEGRPEALFTGKAIGPDTYPDFISWELTGIVAPAGSPETLRQRYPVAV